MPKKVKAFKCDWCSRCYIRLCDINRHESACKNNPARRHCKTCVHGVLAIIGWKLDDDREPVIENIGPYCDFHDKPIHEKPYFIDCEERGSGYFENIYPVPGTCEHYEYKGKAEWTIEEVV